VSEPIFDLQNRSLIDFSMLISKLESVEFELNGSDVGVNFTRVT